MDVKKLAELAAKAQSGDKAAKNALVEACYDDIYYYVFKIVKDEHIAADATQESFLEIVGTLKNLRDPAAFTLWSRRIAYHKSMAHYRGPKEVLMPESDDDGEPLLERVPDESDDVLPEKVVEDAEFRKTLTDIINTLPSEQASALLMYYYENLSIKEIAEIQNTSVGTVKSRLNYAKKAVKVKIEDYEKKTGTKLHSIAVLPLLMRLVFSGEKASIPTLTLQSGAAATVAAVGTGAASATAGTAASGGAVAAGVAAKAGIGALAVKIAAGVVAASVLVGGIGFGVSKLIKKDPESNGSHDTESSYLNGSADDEWKDPIQQLDFKPSDFAGTWIAVQTEGDEVPNDKFTIDENGNLVLGENVYPPQDIVWDPDDGDGLLVMVLYSENECWFIKQPDAEYYISGLDEKYPIYMREEAFAD